MGYLRALFRRIAGVFGRAESEDRLDGEIRAHFDMVVEENLRSGMSEQEAAADARRQMGSIEAMKDSYRDQRGIPFLDTLQRDVRFGMRMLGKHPAFTATAVLTLALGIGANTAMFSIANAVLFKPLPFAHPERLVFVWSTHPQIPREPTSMPDYRDWRSQAKSFEQLAAAGSSSMTLTGSGDPEVIRGVQVSDNYFAAFGMQPLMGRGLDASDANANSIVISSGLWQRRFGANPAVLGSAITLNGIAYTVVGVANDNARYPLRGDYWVPFTKSSREGPRRGDFLSVIGRLKPGITMAQAQAEMNTVTNALERAYPDTNAGFSTRILTLHEYITGDVRKPLLVLVGAVAFILLITCANITNLLLARGTAREREMVVRTALGAGRSHLARQLLVESVVLAVAGGVLGSALAWFGVDLFVRLSPTLLPRMHTVSVDVYALAFALALSVATGLFFGLLPARLSSRINLSDALKISTRTTAGGGYKDRALQALVTAEIALAVALLVGAGLMVRSLDQLASVDPGFRTDGVLAVQLASLPDGSYADQRRILTFYNDLLARAKALPGVTHAAITSSLPLYGSNANGFRIEGAPPVPNQAVQDAHLRSITPQYFQALSIPLLEGRLPAESDVRGGQEVVLVNRFLAKRYFQGRSPIGSRLSVDGRTWWTVVGVIGDIRTDELGEPAREEIAFPMAQRTSRTATLVLKTDGDPLALAGAVRGVVRSVDPNLPVGRIASLSGLTGETLAMPRFRTFLMGAFATLGLVLAALGVYGVMSYAMAQRTHEMGIRMALGARPEQVLGMVVRRGMSTVVVGVAVGLTASAALSRTMGSLLYGVTATDPVAFVGAPVCLVLVALIACVVPGYRATRVDPVLALRNE